MVTNRQYKNFVARLSTLLLLSVLFLMACEDDQMLIQENNRNLISIQIDLDVPGLHQMGARAMSLTKETEIDLSSIQILVFEQMTSGEEIFRYNCIPESYAPIKVKVPVSENNERYRFVVVANTARTNIPEGMLKETAMDQFLFEVRGKWNTDTPIPMWGETEQTYIVHSDQTVSIKMHRALARIDIGTLFKFNNTNPITGQEYEYKDTDKESVWGLNNFKIKEVRVYRTKGRAYAATSNDRISGNEVIIPNIPPLTGYNSDDGTQYTQLNDADNYPLLYSISSTGGDDSMIREIYVPESFLNGAAIDTDSVPCLVIGGYYGEGNTTKLSYYRADFAHYVNGKPNTYLTILRNHRYVFDIRSVSGPGFETPDNALRSVTSKIELEVLEWNEISQDYYMQGDYFFRVDDRQVRLEAKPYEGETEIIYKVPFQTNLELDGTEGKSIAYKWTNGTAISDFFELDIDYPNRILVFKAKQYNVNNGGEKEDSVFLQVENLGLGIKVTQKAINARYRIICDSVTVHGHYRENVPLNYSNYISVVVAGQDADLNGLEYEIKTITKNGIQFKGIGSFNDAQKQPGKNGETLYKIKLEGSGTPVNESGENKFLSFDVIIESNSALGGTCSARIIIAYRTKKILTIGANAIYRYGYMLEPNTASRAFVDASINFGIAPNSTVPMEENIFGNAFTIEVITAGKGMTGERINYDYLLDKLNTFKPDIILTGQAINYFSLDGNKYRIINLLTDFVNKGGVLLMCNEYYPDPESIQAMVSSIMGNGVSGNNQSIGYNQTFTINGDENDLIVNGPFGDMRNKIWGADGHAMHGFTNLPNGTIVYSTRSDGFANMFRHAEKPFFFMGEGGFISNHQRYIGNAYQGSYVYCPFAIDHNYRPVPRINYGINKNNTIYNSLIFGNILTWAIDYSEQYGINHY